MTFPTTKWAIDPEGSRTYTTGTWVYDMGLGPSQLIITSSYTLVVIWSYQTIHWEFRQIPLVSFLKRKNLLWGKMWKSFNLSGKSSKMMKHYCLAFNVYHKQLIGSSALHMGRKDEYFQPNFAFRRSEKYGQLWLLSMLHWCRTTFFHHRDYLLFWATKYGP